MSGAWFPALRSKASRPDRLETKASMTIGNRYGLGSNLPRITSYGTPRSADYWDLEEVVVNGYERVVWVFKAVEIISGNASRLPFQIAVDDEEIESHPLLRVMNKRANPLEFGRAFRKRLSAQLLLSKKGAFVEVTTNRAGSITRLDLLPPNRVRIIPDPGGDYIDYFEFTRWDGEVRNLDPTKVRWIREPHPLDPFSGTTPLEAAGVSVDLDRLARLYNVNFISRDGRPGGVVGIDAMGLPEAELNRIAAIFEGGVDAAGKVYAVGTGSGGLDYIDTAAKPRDMAYGETAELARKEILSAFGVPESIAGDASGRTFDNAAEEKFTFWHEVMLPHLELIASAFDGDVPEEADCRFDTSEVEALEMPARRRRTEAREEVDKGLRTIKEYRSMVPGLDPIDNAQTRALWLQPSKAPVPGDPADAAELGLTGDTGGGMPGGEMPGGAAGALPPGPDGQGPTAADVVAAAMDEGGQPAPAPGTAEAAVADARAGQVEQPIGDAAVAVEAARLEGKSLTEALLDGTLEAKELTPFLTTQPATTETYEPGEEEIAALALPVQAALEALLARQAGVVTARLESRKTRAGTPYWTPAGADDPRAGTNPIDAEKVVDSTRWAGEVQQTLAPIAAPAARDAANGLLAALAASGALVGGTTLAQMAGSALTPPGTDELSAAAGRAAGAATIMAITTAAGAITDWLDARVADINDLIAAQGASPSMPLLVESVRSLWTDHAHDLATSIATTTAQAILGGARDAAILELDPQATDATVGGSSFSVTSEIERVWCCREDEKVRAAHRAAAGQARPAGTPFVVGGYDLRFPSDPLAPPSVARNCRCWLRYQWSSADRFLLRSDTAAAFA